jgi:hypothetical protein
MDSSIQEPPPARVGGAHSPGPSREDENVITVTRELGQSEIIRVGRRQASDTQISIRQHSMIQVALLGSASGVIKLLTWLLGQLDFGVTKQLKHSVAPV